VERRRIGPIQLVVGGQSAGRAPSRPSRINLIVLISSAHRKMLQIDIGKECRRHSQRLISVSDLAADGPFNGMVRQQVSSCLPGV
jgi:hypothetical protein